MHRRTLAPGTPHPAPWSMRPSSHLSVLTVARRYLHGIAAQRRFERVNPVAPAPHRPDPAAWRDDRLTLAWLGHATILLNFYGTWLLTDPALRSRIGVTL